MALDYVYEKLQAAVIGMATSTQSLQERLATAYIYGFHTLNPNDFPKNLQLRYRGIVATFTREEGPDGTVLATTQEMSDQTAIALIEKIVDLYDEVAQLIGKEE